MRRMWIVVTLAALVLAGCASPTEPEEAPAEEKIVVTDDLWIRLCAMYDDPEAVVAEFRADGRWFRVRIEGLGEVYQEEIMRPEWRKLLELSLDWWDNLQAAQKSEVSAEE